MTAAINPNACVSKRAPGRTGTIMSRLLVRWALIVAMTAIAFGSSLIRLAESTRTDSLNGFVWTLPLLAILASYGLSRRRRSELPIHDRQTDVIVGGMGMGLALMLKAVLMPRYALFFDLLRLDLLAMWTFVISATILLFGLRPVMRFIPAWLIMLFGSPLPYHVVVMLLGGGKIAASVVMLGAAAVAAAIGFRHPWLGGSAAIAVGLLVLWVLFVFFPTAPVWALQQIPAVAGLSAVAGWMLWEGRRSAKLPALQRHIKPLAERQVLSGIPVVVVVAALLAMVPLPIPPGPPTIQIANLHLDGPMLVPAGWHITQSSEFASVKRLYGDGGQLVEQRMVADVGDIRWDKLAAPRTVLVATVMSPQPSMFQMYPPIMLFKLASIRASEPRKVDLGAGVIGELIAAVDDNLLITWTVLQWTWRSDNAAQRVLVIAVDDHRPEAPFPNVGNALPSTLDSLVTILFRGNAVLQNRRGVFKDADLLTEFGKHLITAQLANIRQGP